ncbi:hypothetical protein [Xanthomonas maliensis]|uniref:hypothetical protein n=1 Tax=Xanthomonas maliensis TaxID=1321368 RepID=UPI00039F6C3C|nr:hypothetical protein [Xanthomonas maliensis]
MNKSPRHPDDSAGDQHGEAESQQNRQHDEAAKQRPGQKDMQIHDEHSRRPSSTPPSK